MEQLMKTILTPISKMAYKRAEKEVNKTCPYFHNQPPIPEKVERLRRLKKYD